MSKESAAFIDIEGAEYYLSFGEVPEMRLTDEEWHSLLAALGARFELTASQYERLAPSLKKKFLKIY